MSAKCCKRCYLISIVLLITCAIYIVWYIISVRLHNDVEENSDGYPLTYYKSIWKYINPHIWKAQDSSSQHAYITNKMLLFGSGLLVITVLFVKVLWNIWSTKHRGWRKTQWMSYPSLNVILGLITLVLSLFTFLMTVADIYSYQLNFFISFGLIAIVSMISVYNILFTQLSFFHLVMKVFIVLFLISLPWEFIRMYQYKVAEKMANSLPGMPVECMSEQISMWHTLKLWIKETFTWKAEDPCLKYHNALLVEPLWEVTPLIVLMSVISRCLTEPVKHISHSIGLSFNLLFAHIPAQWQPVIMALIVVVALVLLTTLCSYRITIPWLLHFEPHSHKKIAGKRVIKNKVIKQT